MIDTYGRKYVQPAIDYTAGALVNVGLSANQVTAAAFLVGAITGPLIYAGQPWVAVVLLWLSGYLDAVDGTMARQTTSSGWGTVMDVTFDRLVEISVILGLAFRYPGAQLALLVLATSIIFSITVFLTVGAVSDQRGVKSFYYQAGLAERTEGFILLTAMTLLSRWLVPLTILFVLIETFTGLQRMLEARKILGGKASE